MAIPLQTRADLEQGLLFTPVFGAFGGLVGTTYAFALNILLEDSGTDWFGVATFSGVMAMTHSATYILISICCGGELEVVSKTVLKVSSLTLAFLVGITAANLVGGFVHSGDMIAIYSVQTALSMLRG
ncbi:MAG: hypothetical protein SP1CHLAM54_07850 [Chlamydiia bacterium]|nr:hypothetical protein [Chlamydiia bacterium]MCH9615691.1 hypothetical protein [Chlamydiia bacterium]MCH9628906.1 hypothetical protein [Chlamydiia bacterium]